MGHLMDNVINGLKKAVNELEELQVQASLGKAEASDKYAETKKKFNSLIHEAKGKLDKGHEKAAELKNKFSELEQLFEQKASETKKDLKEEVKKFEKTLSDIQRYF